VTARRAAPGLVPALLLALLSAGPAPARSETVRVFAAASLTEAFADIAAEYRRHHPGDIVELNFGGSQLLRTQIEQGAPADLFVSADEAHMAALADAGLLRGDAAVCARNRLVIVVPAGRPRIRRLADLAQPGVRVVVANANVPVGRYTSLVLDRMTRAGLFGDDFRSRVTANVVSQETSVRGVLAKVALDEADAGFVYATDAAAAAGKVAVLDIPDRMNAVAEYPIAVLAGSRVPDAAARVLEFVLGETGQALLAKRGFQPGR
jgi:molybdate transport system substrate-binding protein